MLLSHKNITKTVEQLVPWLQPIVERDRYLNDKNIREAIIAARKKHPSISNLQSTRSLQLVAEIYIEQFN